MPTSPRSSAYQRFAESVLGAGPAWQEAVDVDALLALSHDERRLAEKLLIERIAHDDWRAPAALAAAVTRGAVMPMKRRMPLADGRMRVAMALALADLEAIEGAVPIVAEVLRGGDKDAGLAAVSALATRAQTEERVPLALDALAWAAMNHPAGDVRAAAGAALIHLTGFAADPLAWEFRALWQGLLSDDSGSRRPVLARILGLAEAEAEAGAAPGGDAAAKTASSPDPG